MEILHTLGINPAVMLAQALNFFLLLGILTFFVYKPVLRLLDARKKRLADAEAHAQEIENKLAHAEELTKKELQTAQAQASKILTAARANAKQQETALLATAQQKFDRLVTDGRALIQKERTEAITQLKKEVSQIVLLATSKLLAREIQPQDQEQWIKEALVEVENSLAAKKSQI